MEEEEENEKEGAQQDEQDKEEEGVEGVRGLALASACLRSPLTVLPSPESTSTWRIRAIRGSFDRGGRRGEGGRHREEC
jgi:hypothetical protein